MIIVCIDVGTVRVGCAWGDSSVKIPFPVAVWERAQGRAEKALLREIRDRKAEVLVVGLPLGPHGERTATCETVEGFVARIAKRNPIKVVYVDEAFSSEEATDKLRSAGVVSSTVDSHAACQILERYFESLTEQSSK